MRETSPTATRLLQVALRTVHVLGMALILGALPFEPRWDQLRVPVLTTVGSGLGLFALEAAKNPRVLLQGSGVALLVKLALLGCGHLWPSERFVWYLAATAVASAGSHAPGAWRHYSFRRGKA